MLQITLSLRLLRHPLFACRLFASANNQKNARFEWDGNLDHPHITNLDLDLHRGKLYGVVGDVGSCKSFIASIMGQLKMKQGSVDIFTNEFSRKKTVTNDAKSEIETVFKFGYVPQDPWLIEASLRDNIVFGEEWDDTKYAEVVRVCGLMRDILLLPEGDESNITDVILTPAQRQRISFARCLYHESDIVLLEDCLSDFDAGASKTLFNQVVKGYILKMNKCVVYYTQQKQV